MKIIQEFTCPDGVLKLMVAEGEDGEKAVGFEGSDWHTHADLIHYWLSFPKEKAIEQFLKAVMEDKLPIITSIDGGESQNPWISDNLEQSIKVYGEENCQFRLWRQSTISASQALHLDSLPLAGER